MATNKIEYSDSELRKLKEISLIKPSSGEYRTQVVGTDKRNVDILLSEPLLDTDRVLPTKAVLSGKTDGGLYKDIPATEEGHIEVAVHDPLTTFGYLDTSTDTVVFQSDFTYGILGDSIYTVTSGSGTTTSSNQLGVLTTGTTIYSYSVLESRRRLRYRPGQGVKVAFTAMYDTPVINSYQGAGCGTAENGIYFGYGDTNDLTDTSFGILHVRGGKREIKTLTVTTKATSAGNVTVTLNGTAFTVPVTDATAGTLQKTVWDIATYTGYTGWDAYPKGATVVFVRKSAGATAGTQSFGAGTTGSAATIVQTRAGVASTDTFYPQSEWNMDVCDGSGSEDNPSGFTLNPQALNIFRFKIGYLGTHDIICQVRVSPDGNNPTWLTVHKVPFIGNSTTTSFTNPSFPFNSFAYSAGSTTDLTLTIGSFYGAVEGSKNELGSRAVIDNTLSASVTNAAYWAICTVLNPRVFNSVINQAVLKIVVITGAAEHNNPVKFYMIKNGALVGNPNFTQYSTYNCTLYDTAATQVTFSTNDQKQFTASLGSSGNFIEQYSGQGTFNAEEFTVQPGEWYTLCAIGVGAGSATVSGSINIREDK